MDNPLDPDLYKQIFEHSPVAMWVMDYSQVLMALEELDTRGMALKTYLNHNTGQVSTLLAKSIILDVSTYAYRGLGYHDKKDIISHPGNRFQNIDPGAIIDELIAIHERKAVFETIVENSHVDGKLRKFMLRWKVFPGHEEKMDMVLANTIDITEQVQSNKIQTAIYQISNAATTTNNLGELYQSIHMTLGELMPSRNFYIALYHEAEGMISFPYFVDEVDPKPEPKVFGNGLTEYVIRTGQPLLLSQENVVKLLEAEGITSYGYDSIDWLGVPLKIEEKLIGIIAVQSYSEGVRYSEREKEILVFVSNQIAMAIDRKRAEDELKYASMHDALTGLYNRGYFEEELKRLSSGRQSPVGVIIADLDNLKKTNDSLGHAAGDAIIRAFCAELVKNFRSSDVVARIGGDEFGILLPTSPLVIVEKAVERLQTRINEYNDTNPVTPLRYSLGYHTNEQGCSLQEAMHIADERMYLHKSLNKLSPEQ